MDSGLTTIFIVLMVLIGLAFYFFNPLKKNEPYTKELETDTASSETEFLLLQVEEFSSTLEEAKKAYIRHSQEEVYKNRFLPLYQTLVKSKRPQVIFNTKFKKFKETYLNLDGLIKSWNANYLSREVESNRELFDNIDGRSLDYKQRIAAVIDEDNTLVVAGAGTGKTLTISAKVKYLVDKKNVKPEEILLLSFTRKAAEEMQQRISERLGIGVQARTFHSLGLQIVSHGYGKRPEVLDPDMGAFDKLLDTYFEEEILNNPKEMADLLDFFAYYLNIPQDLEKYNNLGELYEENRSLDFETLKSKVELRVSSLKQDKRTIQGERVRSLEEVTIANFLYLHGVRYEYEKKYPFDTGDSYKKTYRPDFYLVDYDVYLEHFGVNENGRTPWLSPIEERKYLDGMAWKRNIHKVHYTRLIETYSYQNKDGQLTTALDSLLRANGVKYHEVDLKLIHKMVFTQNKNRHFVEFKKLIKTFITLFKSNGYSDSSFIALTQKARLDKNDFLKKRSLLFLSIVQPIYLRYQGFLSMTNQIDFEDMINLATEALRLGRFSPTYKYVIVDEYQDISASRFKLINEIRMKSNAQVMAVGDDWQSIYRFSGSDISLFTEFPKYFGYTEIVYIDQTYRNSQDLIDISGQFIMKNNKQFKKKLVSDKKSGASIFLHGYETDVLTAVKKVIDIISRKSTSKEILILGRTNYDVNIFDSEQFLYSEYFDHRGEFKVLHGGKDVVIKYIPRPDLKINFLTVHKAKGLEAENVIVLNLENSLLGFPNKISDDPVLSLVLTDQDEFEYAEERRLFYVALTRTKNNVYLLVNDRNPSIFADEMRVDFHVPYGIYTGEETILNHPNCPRCMKGYLVLRKNSNNESAFLGCSNFPQCEYSVKNVEILDEARKCDQCGGFMVLRDGKNGKFYGCTNYPYCHNAFDVVWF